MSQACRQCFEKRFQFHIARLLKVKSDKVSSRFQRGTGSAQPWKMTGSATCILFTAGLVFTFVCSDDGVNKGCDHSRGDDFLEKANCRGYEVAVHSTWTEIQCLDNCFRHTYCDKYIFDGQGNQNCKLLFTGVISDIPGAASLPIISGQCAPKDTKHLYTHRTLKKILLGTKDCHELQNKDVSNSEIDNGGVATLPSNYVNGGK